MNIALSSRSSRWGLLLAFCCLAAASPVRAGGIAADLTAQIQSQPLSLQSRRVIVQYQHPGAPSSLLALLNGAQLIRELPHLNGAVMSLAQISIPGLALDPSVKWISPDRTIKSQGDFDVEAAGADIVWNTYGRRGTGVRVAVLDTGIRGSTAEWSTSGTSRVAAWNDLVNFQPAPYDDNGHGTHVAGIVLGAGSASAGQISGTAPAADLVGVKVLAQDGSGLTSTVIAGIDWCIANKVTHNIRVINLSLGQKPVESSTTDPLCAAVRRAVDAGIVVVCSAGNKGKNSSSQTVWGGIGSPGIEPSAITVGALNTQDTATRADDTVCTYSSRGPTYADQWVKPDLLAPGNGIVSVRAPGSRIDNTYPLTRVDWDPSTAETIDYTKLSGTSMAAPQVAGVIALMLEAAPSMDPNTIKGVLMYTAEHLPLGLSSGLDLLTQGAGALNAPGAVDLAGRLNHSAAIGSAWLTSGFSGQSTVGSVTFPWYASIPWSTNVYTGTDLFTYRQQAWSTEVRWGQPSTWYPSAVYSANGVAADMGTWSNQAAWNDSGIWGNQMSWGGDDEMVTGEPTTPALGGGG